MWHPTHISIFDLDKYTVVILSDIGFNLNEFCYINLVEKKYSQDDVCSTEGGL